MTTTKAYDDLVERLGREKEVQPLRVNSPEGQACLKALIQPKRKGGWPKGKPRKPKAAK